MSSRLNSYFKSSWRIVFIFIVLAIALHSVPNFYFWHDDFSSLYSNRIGVCIHGWPYISFCPLFYYLDKIFGYSPHVYFTIGVLLAAINVLVFYRLIVKLFKNKNVYLASSLYATSLVGISVFKEAWDPLVTFPTLIFLFLSFSNLLDKSFYKSVLYFIVSLIFLQARSSMNITIAVIFILLFLKTYEVKIKYILVFAATFVFGFIVLPFVLVPLMGNIFSGYSIEQGTLNIGNFVGAVFNNSGSINILSRVVNFITTLGAVFIPDILHNPGLETLRTIVGFIIITSSLFVLFKSRKNAEVFRVRLFAVFWVLIMYFPYGIRSSWRIESDHRYLAFVFPGIIMFWATFYFHKWWKVTSLALIVFGILIANNVLTQNLEISLVRENFYNALHRSVPNFGENPIIYFDFPDNIKASAADFFRVGLLPPESAIATEYKISYKNITLLTDSKSVDEKRDEIGSDRFYSFYFDGDKLVNTTEASRNLLNTNKRFDIKDYEPFIPSHIFFTVTSSIGEIKKGDDCYKIGKCQDITEHELNFLMKLNDFRNKVEIDADGAQTKALYDDNTDTFWMADRKSWLDKTSKRPTILMKLKTPISAAGIAINTGPSPWGVNNVLFKVNGREVDYQKLAEGNMVKLLVDIENATNIEISILSTNGSDAPIIREVYLLPAGYEDVDINKIEQKKYYPASKIDSQEEKMALISYLKSGALACVEWSSVGYGGKTYFKLISDGKPHQYEVSIPSLGIDMPSFSVGCTNYPVKTETIKMEVSY